LANWKNHINILDSVGKVATELFYDVIFAYIYICDVTDVLQQGWGTYLLPRAA